MWANPLCLEVGSIFDSLTPNVWDQIEMMVPAVKEVVRRHYEERKADRFLWRSVLKKNRERAKVYNTKVCAVRGCIVCKKPFQITWMQKFRKVRTCSKECSFRLMARSKGKEYTYKGKTLSVGEWSEASGIPRQLINKRLAAGWKFSEAISVPSRKKTS